MRNVLIRDIMTCRTKVVLTFIVLLLAFNAKVLAQSNTDQQWWFNVELIVFKRTVLSTNNENFDNEQFELDFTNSNNLLYVEALKQATQLESLNSALPFCDAIQNTDGISATLNTNGLFGVTFDFEYLPDTNFALTDIVDITLIQTPVAIISTEETYDIQINSHSDTITPTESNQSIMSALLAPLIIDRSIFDDEIENVIDSLTELKSPSAISETDTQENHIDALNNIILNLSEQLKQNQQTLSQITCLQTQAQQAVLSESVLSTIGPRLFSKSGQFRGTKQVISEQEIIMSDYAKQVFRQRDIQPLLYTAWRQNVEFGIENAEFYRIRAGNLLETSKKVSYDTWHKKYLSKTDIDPQADESLFFDELEKALVTNDAVDWLTIDSSIDDAADTSFVAQRKYELEGQFKVYLDYVNQVPYLHIDSEFNHYKLMLDEEGSSFFETFPFKQRRRIISKQIHYFDHPAFGLIVRLERFTPPAVDETLNEDEALFENEAIVDDEQLIEDLNNNEQ